MKIKNTENMEKEFVWTDGLVKDFIIRYNNISGWISGIDPIMQTIQEFKENEVNKPIFHTDDGKAIYPGDKWYWVSEWKVHEQKGLINGSKMYDNSCAFSTEEKATKYIQMNKPVLSVSDICNVITVSQFQCISRDSEIGYLVYSEEIERKIENLAKQKINP